MEKCDLEITKEFLNITTLYSKITFPAAVMRKQS